MQDDAGLEIITACTWISEFISAYQHARTTQINELCSVYFMGSNRQLCCDVSEWKQLWFVFKCHVSSSQLSTRLSHLYLSPTGSDCLLPQGIVFDN